MVYEMESYNMDDVGENPFSDPAASEQGEVNEDDGDMLATGSVRSNDTAASFDLEDDLADVAVDTPHSSLPHEGPESNVEQQDGMPSYSEDIMPKDSVLTGRALLYFTSIFVSIGVFLFGYDQGVMSGCLTGHYFRDHFHNPSRAAIGVMVSILEVGALCSSLMVSRLGEKWGRRRTIKYGSLVFVIGGLFQAFAGQIGHLIAGRLISGLGVGLLSTIVPIYQSEISPPHNRGKLACIEFTGNIVGYATSVWIDYGCSYFENDASWRVPLFLQSVIGFTLFCGSFVIVETPRWLLNHDRDVEGYVVIANLYSNGDINHQKAKEEYQSIKETVLISRMQGEGRSYIKVFKRYRKRMLLAMSSQMFAQLNGINVISYYAPLVFEQAGWVGRKAILMTGVNGIMYIISTLPPWILVDKWGRKPMLMTGSIFMGFALVFISLSMLANIAATPKLVVIFVVIFNSSFGFSWGPIPWLFPVEIAPLSARSAMASASTATNWLCNWLVGIMTPILEEKITWGLYLLHATSCFSSFVAVYKVYPETAGVRLEDMDTIFNDKLPNFGISKSGSDANNTVAESEMITAKNNADSDPFKSPDDEVNFKSNQSTMSRTTAASSIQAGTIETPSMEQILDFKRQQKGQGLRTFIRRGSQGVSRLLHRVLPTKNRNNGAYDTIWDNDLEHGM
ncbi:YDL199C [Zygosaccharomyces parabailii]|uniref:BN860_14532g1_1 n=1 Tax=Zygosaccharomyces bailii (strain CLIB 213 / ATCC 58445 / CBS 680 / BCRC 21525 / NBRC 1098 / NCYC 1416 / NRRL Y-2227) TaxID=1333698 RepID=A0A8J2T3N0_ZYGB2|nr:YDL199C [Zygosaccharomyces parabailii]CDF87789.1 BN860_14532g1_1 [Zygosaccharomyces bailii CLIB 213]CDH17849.1 related to sugar transporter STL1 [Zygosaccharomyces bailii ISA1307]